MDRNRRKRTWINVGEQFKNDSSVFLPMEISRWIRWGFPVEDENSKAQITVVWKQKLSQQILSLKKLPEERDFCNILKNVKTLSTLQELVPLSLILDRKDG